jgi:putative aminopeptidase FrvX
MIKFDLEAFKSISEKVFNCDSPSGYNHNIVKLLSSYLDEYNVEYKVHNKGTIEVFIKGNDSSKVVATSAHVDTLGLMVRSIKGNGNLALTKIGDQSYQH